MVTQLLLNGIVSGSAFALIGLSFYIIYAPAKFLHFTHGAVYAVAAYATLAALTWMRLPLLIAVALGGVMAIVLGCVCEFCLYRPLRYRGASGLVAMLASLGAYVVLQNGISLLFGDDVKSLSLGEVTEGTRVFGARLASAQIAIVVGCACAFALSRLVLTHTEFGKALRAVTSDSELASIRGVDVARTTLGAFAFGSGLVGLAGVLVGLDVGLTPTMGLNALMMGIVAMIAGGTRSPIGILLGGLMLGFAQSLGVWKIGSQWQDSIAFVILVAFVLLRPQGVLGRLPKKSRV